MHNNIEDNNCRDLIVTIHYLLTHTSVDKLRSWNCKFAIHRSVSLMQIRLSLQKKGPATHKPCLLEPPHQSSLDMQASNLQMEREDTMHSFISLWDLTFNMEGLCKWRKRKIRTYFPLSSWMFPAEDPKKEKKWAVDRFNMEQLWYW